jgi:hypothetical protein
LLASRQSSPGQLTWCRPDDGCGTGLRPQRTAMELPRCAHGARRVLRCVTKRVREEEERVGYWVARKGWGGTGPALACVVGTESMAMRGSCVRAVREGRV